MLSVAGARPVGELLAPADDVASAHDVVVALQRVLADTWLVPDWDTAVLLQGRARALSFVTPAGDVAGPRGFHGGGSPERSAVLTATAALEAEQRAATLGVDPRGGRGTARRRRFGAGGIQASGLARATERINESDARITGAAERLARCTRSSRPRPPSVGSSEANSRNSPCRSIVTLGRSADLESRGPEADPTTRR